MTINISLYTTFTFKTPIKTNIFKSAKINCRTEHDAIIWTRTVKKMKDHFGSSDKVAFFVETFHYSAKKYLDLVIFIPPLWTFPPTFSRYLFFPATFFPSPLFLSHSCNRDVVWFKQNWALVVFWRWPWRKGGHPFE